MFLIAAIVAYLFALLTFFGWAVNWSTSTGLGLVAVGLLCQTLAALPTVVNRMPGA